MSIATDIPNDELKRVLREKLDEGCQLPPQYADVVTALNSGASPSRERLVGALRYLVSQQTPLPEDLVRWLQFTGGMR